MIDPSDIIQCRLCGDETNHAPSYFPPEIDGLCPSCAVGGMESGALPKPSREAMAKYIADAIVNQIASSGDTSVIVVNLSETRSPSEIIDTPVGPIQYSQN